MAYFPPPESSGGWRRVTGINATPTNAQKEDIRAKTGVDWDKLKLAYDYSQSFGGGSTLLVIRNGWIAGEWGNTNAARVASASKSLTALATAKMYELSDAGRLEKTIDAESFAYDFLPATWDDGDARKRKIRIKHLTTMTSGLVPDDRPGQPNYLNVVLTQPVKVPPETEWSYASLPVDLLSIVIQSATGKTVRDFFNQEIAGKIGIPALRWRAIGRSLPVDLLSVVIQSAPGDTVRNFFNPGDRRQNRHSRALMADPRAVYERIERRVHSAPRPCSRRLPHDDGRRLGRTADRLEEVRLEHPAASLVPGRHTVCPDTRLAVYGRERFAEVLRAPLVDQRHGRRARRQSAPGCIPRAGLQREPPHRRAKSRHGRRADGLESRIAQGVSEYVHVAGHGCGRHDTLG